MNKGMHRYLFVVTTLFTLNGCGDSSAVTDKKDMDRDEHQAVYIEPEKLSAEEIKMSKLIQNTLAHDEIGIGIEESIEVKEKSKTEKLHSNILYKTIVNKVLEDAEDGTTNGWINYDNSPKGAAISNVYDNDKKSHVIEVKGSGYKNGFKLPLGNDVRNRTIKWSMKLCSLCTCKYPKRLPLPLLYSIQS